MWPIMPTPNRGTLSIIGLYNWDDHIFDQLALPPGVDFTDVTQNILMECGELETIYPDWEFMYNAIGFWSDRELPTWEHIYEMTQVEYNPIENYDRMETETEGENVAENRLRASQRTRSSDLSSDTTSNENSAQSRESSQTGGNISTETIHSGSENNSTTQNNTENKVAGFNTDTLATQSGSAGNSVNVDRSNGNSLAINEQNNNASGSETENRLNQANQKTVNSGSETDAGNELNKGDVSRDKTRQLHAHGNIGVTTVAEMMAGELETYPKINIVAYITQAFKERFCLLVY